MNQKTIWALTLGLAVMMVAGAVILAQKRVAPPQTVAPVAAVSKPAPAVEASAVVLAPAPAASVTAAAALGAADAPGGVLIDEIKVDLSRVAGTLKMISPDIPASQNDELPRYPLELTCYRNNASPSLSWQGAPEGTAAFVLVLERRAATEKALWSWIMLDVPGGARGMRGNISAESLGLEQGILARNAFDNAAYAGPCEPKGSYLYVLRLFALDQALGLPGTATTTEIVAAMEGHIVDAAEIRAQHYLQK
ncbi:MAG: YbhB/YbcL family Raf kinase inhibitor-like protein [Micavibrio aeruginosavorus]|uniref:YbhB/YbcL family Raf kinase inhibitor-like protein n=1 Tax=Micavibrio aeruginosavorus TaxID=349221 RepID=A0A7T5R0B0_9BACT|nr:MAG: YbhB/YbcL family Raf kinase inhibitor-like protein [Micavibrio aeruginosavorus]